LSQVVTELGTGPSQARRMLEANDRARTASVKHFYRVDPASPRLYHLVLDAARLPEAACVELAVAAAQAI
jgi:cytidylate kinase